MASGVWESLIQRQEATSASQGQKSEAAIDTDEIFFLFLMLAFLKNLVFRCNMQMVRRSEFGVSSMTLWIQPALCQHLSSTGDGGGYRKGFPWYTSGRLMSIKHQSLWVHVLFIATVYPFYPTWSMCPVIKHKLSQTGSIIMRFQWYPGWDGIQWKVHSMNVHLTNLWKLCHAVILKARMSKN